MRRIRIRIAYDGTGYCGFQLQPELPTVEGELNKALSLLTHEDIHIIGASRTDSGVHALGNVAVFDTASTIPAEKFPLACAQFLPPDIRITEGAEVPADWHPRKQDCIKTYEYVISCGSTENPLGRLYSSFCRRELNIEKMRAAAGYLTGEHDFTSFANPSSQLLMEGGSAVRRIYSIEIIKKSEEISGEKLEMGEEPQEPCQASCQEPCQTPCQVLIRVTGNGFLYNMVRIIAGTLIQVGSGLWEPERVREALLARNRTKAGPTAEARGLRLVQISYDDTWRNGFSCK